MTNKVSSLTRAMTEAVARKESAEVVYELMMALASAMDDESMKYPATRGSIDESAARVRRSASTMLPMFGGTDAENAWREQRNALPWFKRRKLPRHPDKTFLQSWMDTQRERGRMLARSAVSKAA